MKNQNHDLNESRFREIFYRCCERYNVSRETLEIFVVYERLLLEWQNKLNLVGRNTLDELWARHFGDSLQLLLYIDNVGKYSEKNSGKYWLDLGSGAGFPGAVIGVFLKDYKTFRVDLVESNAKKCAFLRKLKIETGANFGILNKRIEDINDENLVKTVDYITARGLTSLLDSLDYCAKLSAPSTKLILQKGKDVDRELSEACKNWKIVYTIKQSIAYDNSYIVIVDSFEKKLGN